MRGGRIRKTHTMPDDTSNHGRLPRDGAEGNDKLLQVLGAGIEPAWGCPHRILRPARLPVPPPERCHVHATATKIAQQWQSNTGGFESPAAAIPPLGRVRSGPNLAAEPVGPRPP